MTIHHRLFGLIAVLFAIALVAGCDSPSPPSPPNNPQPPGPGPVTPPANSAPVISRISVNVTRTEVNRDVELEVELTDAETSVDSLAYQWTTTLGTVTATGRRATWRLAKGANTPANVTVMVVVTEPFQVLENGILITREHRVEATSPQFRVHDSDGEVGDLVNDFLSDFVNNSVPAAACVRNFSDNCPGKFEELNDVQNIRDDYVVLNSNFALQSISFNGAMTTSNVIASCRFQSLVKDTGMTETSNGVCLFTAIYEANVWKLCSSNFSGQTSAPNNLFFGRPQKIIKRVF